MLRMGGTLLNRARNAILVVVLFSLSELARLIKGPKSVPKCKQNVTVSLFIISAWQALRRGKAHSSKHSWGWDVIVAAFPAAFLAINLLLLL